MQAWLPQILRCSRRWARREFIQPRPRVRLAQIPGAAVQFCHRARDGKPPGSSGHAGTTATLSPRAGAMACLVLATAAPGYANVREIAS